MFCCNCITWQETMWFLLIAFVIPYLVGIIPFGEIYSRLLGHGSLKQQGSGNIGTTNAYRIGGKLLGILTLISDVAKGALVTFISPNPWTALAVIMGHIRVPFFSGGKGIATSLGALLILKPIMALSLVFIWIAVFIWKRTSSLSGLVTFSMLPVYAYIFNFNLCAAFLISGIVIFAHRENIKRLMYKKEATTGLYR